MFLLRPAPPVRVRIDLRRLRDAMPQVPGDMLPLPVLRDYLAVIGFSWRPDRTWVCDPAALRQLPPGCAIHVGAAAADVGGAARFL